MSDNPPLTEKYPHGRLFLPSLVMSGFATRPPSILTGLLLIDIGLTFGSPVGITGQIRTVSSSVAVISALLLGALSVRYNHKSLLMMGLLFLSISALGCGIAPNYYVMLVLFSLTGIGAAIVEPMAITLVGEHFPIERRASVIGWIVADMSTAWLIGSPVIGFIAGYGGWRLAFLGFVLPIEILSLFLVATGLPSTPRSH